MSTTFHRMLIGIVVMVVIGFLLWGIFLTAFAAWYAYADRGRPEVTAKLDALRASGVPVDNESLDAWYRERTDPADARAWQVVFAKLQSPEFKSLTLGIEGFDPRAKDTKRTADKWPAEDASRRLLAGTTELRKEIHRLASKQVAVQFPIQFDSIRTQPDYLPFIRNASRLIQLESDAAIQDQNSPEIVASAKTQIDLAMVVSGDGSLIAQLYANALRGTGFRALKEALERDLIDAADLESLATQLSQPQFSSTRFRDAIRCERASGLPAFFAPGKYLSDGASEIPKNYQAAAQDLLHYLDYMERLETLEQLPMAEAIEKAKQIESDLKTRREQAGMLGTREWMLTWLLVPTTGTTFYSFCRDRQDFNMVMHGIAIRRYQDQLGEFPRDLSALNDIGFDTFDYMPVGKRPMGYRRDGDETILWSTPPSLGLETTLEPLTLEPNDRNYDLIQSMIWKFTP